MKAAFTIPVLLTLAVLNGCMLMHESDPSVIRSSVRIDMAKRGDLQLATGWLRDVIYIEKPSLCACGPNTEWTLFVLDADGGSATQVKVYVGQSAGDFVEVQRGLKTGDRVIVSDMAAYHEYRYIDLR
jgi:HlyD family secretion protein